MAIILDADVIIKGEKGSFDLIGWLDSQTGQDLEIAAPSRPFSIDWTSLPTLKRQLLFMPGFGRILSLPAT